MTSIACLSKTGMTHFGRPGLRFVPPCFPAKRQTNPNPARMFSCCCWLQETFLQAQLLQQTTFLFQIFTMLPGGGGGSENRVEPTPIQSEQ